MTNSPALLGSPLTTAIQAPLGNAAGAGPHLSVVDFGVFDLAVGAAWADRREALIRSSATSENARRIRPPTNCWERILTHIELFMGASADDRTSLRLFDEHACLWRAADASRLRCRRAPADCCPNQRRHDRPSSVHLCHDSHPAFKPCSSF